ncbi:MAG: cytochrome P450 [Hyphomicrobiaceae bacterium]
MNSPTESDLSLSDPAVFGCPFHAYAQLQANAPVYRDPKTGYYEVTGYQEIREIASDTVTYSNKVNRQNSRTPELQAQMKQLYDAAGFPPVPTLLNNDPPDHRKVRSLVDKAFMPARMNALQPAILVEVTRLIDAVIDRGEMEFMGEFAISLPLNIVADQLGIPRADRPIIKAGSDALVYVADPNTPDDMMLELVRRIVDMQKLLADRIDNVRRHPDDTILSVVANADGAEERYEIPMLVHLFQSILVAGNETTTNALGNTLLMLIDDSQLFARLRDDKALVRPFVEEALRVKAPFQGFYRLATADKEVGGVLIPKGAIVVIRWGAAGRDEKIFACPEQMQFDRPPSAPKHLVFGWGAHACLGNLLARAELRTAVEEITRRMANLRLADSPTARVLAPSFLNQAVARIELRFDKVA